MTDDAPDPNPDLSAYTPHQQATARHLVDVHDHLRSELTQLVALIDQVVAGSLAAAEARSLVNAMTMRQNNWTLGAYCASYCRVVTMHHSYEDAGMFPHLRSRDASLAPVIDRLEADHHVIAGFLEALDEALVALVSEPDGVARLRVVVLELADTLNEHLAYEERMLLEPLAKFGFGLG